MLKNIKIKRTHVLIIAAIVAIICLRRMEKNAVKAFFTNPTKQAKAKKSNSNDMFRELLDQKAKYEEEIAAKGKKAKEKKVGSGYLKRLNDMEGIARAAELASRGSACKTLCDC